MSRVEHPGAELVGVAPARAMFTAALAAAEPDQDLVGVGADLEPHTLVAGYASGVFPMGVRLGRTEELGWWSPDPRGVLPLDGLRVTRSLRKVLPRFEIRVDSAFAQVVTACADPSREGAWITPAIAQAYLRLHTMGLAHSVECWQGPELVGGLYGVCLGGLFAGESMFHRVTDASKVALVALVQTLRQGRPDAVRHRLLDVQWATEHLSSLGAVEVSRGEYVKRLPRALAAPTPTWSLSRWPSQSTSKRPTEARLGGDNGEP